MYARALVTATLASLVAACSHDASNAPKSSLSPDARTAGVAQAVSSVAPNASVATAPAAIASAAGASAAISSPAASAASAAGAPQAAATNPQILSVATTPSVIHAGEAVSWDVRTTPDIVTVTAHVSAYTIPLHRTAPGRFALSFTVPPSVPGIFHGVYNLDVTAETKTGASVKRTISMSFQ